MNIAMVRYILGFILQIEAVLLLLPTAVSLYYGDAGVRPLFLTAMLTALIGYALRARKPQNQVIYAREGFAVVTLSWLLLSAMGALPFWLSGEIPMYVDAFFETVSGFTTTGASILPAVEGMSKSLLFWRSFTHWIGGMGVLVFALAVLPMADNRSIHLMRAEVPGPTAGKLVPKMKDTAKILYTIYLGLTILQVLLLVFGGMSWFDSLIHTFGSAGTGGFSNYNLSVGAFGNAYFEWVIGFFVILFGINFNLYFFLLIRNFRSVYKNEELRLYLAIISLAVLAITFNILPIYQNLADSIRTSFFQVASIMTTTRM